MGNHIISFLAIDPCHSQIRVSLLTIIQHLFYQLKVGLWSLRCFSCILFVPLEAICTTFLVIFLHFLAPTWKEGIKLADNCPLPFFCLDLFVKVSSSLLSFHFGISVLLLIMSFICAAILSYNAGNFFRQYSGPHFALDFFN